MGDGGQKTLLAVIIFSLIVGIIVAFGYGYLPNSMKFDSFLKPYTFENIKQSNKRYYPNVEKSEVISEDDITNSQD